MLYKGEGMIKSTTLFLLFTCTLINGDICFKCRQTQTHGMSSADCYDLNLREVPQCLKSDVEIMELSFNRIRKIGENDLSKYYSLRFLYLSDNMIMNIEENALKDKTVLEVLDISYNAFTKIPAVIFHLPSLKKLYMSQNQNINIVHEIENSKPITSPLMYLNIGYNDLMELPNLGIIPTLMYYNISGNMNIKMNTSKFAGICKLKVLYNNNTTAWFDDPCECWNLQKWLEKRNVDFLPFNCQPKDCNPEVPLDDLEIFNECNKLHDEIIQRATLLKIVLPICLCALVLILLLLVFIIKKRRQKSILRGETNKIALQGLL